MPAAPARAEEGMWTFDNFPIARANANTYATMGVGCPILGDKCIYVAGEMISSVRRRAFVAAEAAKEARAGAELEKRFWLSGVLDEKAARFDARHHESRDAHAALRMDAFAAAAKQLAGFPSFFAAPLFRRLRALYGAPPLPTPGGAGPTFAGASLSAAPSGALRATVRFEPASLAGGALVFNPPHTSPWSNSSRCPTETNIIKASDCGFFNILGSDGVSYNATDVAVGADGVTLELAAQAPAGTGAAGTEWGWNAWPVVSFYTVAGLPMVPWRVVA
jgi:hypothetical protein